jgi:hypothetical protein
LALRDRPLGIGSLLGGIPASQRSPLAVAHLLRDERTDCNEHNQQQQLLDHHDLLGRSPDTPVDRTVAKPNGARVEREQARAAAGRTACSTRRPTNQVPVPLA